MITYRELAEYMLCLIEDEGKMDAQSHIGTMVAHEGFAGLEEYFKAKTIKTWGEIKEGQKCFYIYYTPGTDTDYIEIAAAYFANTDLALLKTEDGQKIAVYAVAPEICVTYKQ